MFAIDIGAGVTSIAAFSLDGIIAGLSMNVGGSNMDVHIIDHIADTFSLKIGSLTSEKLKNTVGSLIEDDNQSTIINGRDIKSGRPRSVSVSSADIVFPIKVYIDKIAEYADLVLKKLPAEVSAAMLKNGLYLSGGVCNIAGLAEYMSGKLQMEAHLSGDPQMAVVLGGGRAVGKFGISCIYRGCSPRMAQDFVVKILFIGKSCVFCLTATTECGIVIAPYGD